MGTGEASLSLSNGSLVITPPVLMLNSVGFDTFSFEMGLNNQKLTLSQIDLRGKSLICEATGSIALKVDFLESRIDLRGWMEPLADLFKNIPDSEDAARFFQKRLKDGRLSFRVLGTINEPRIQLI